MLQPINYFGIALDLERMDREDKKFFQETEEEQLEKFNEGAFYA